MAERSGFFNSVNGDRKYDAARFAEYFSAFISNGVFPNPATGLQVVANGDMSLTVKAGQGWINGYHYINDSDLILNLEVAGGVLNRIDRIVLQFSTTDRVIAVKVKTGTLASSPVALALQRDADIYELGLADVYVGVGVTSILQANITDLRFNSTYCGIVTGVIDQIDTTDLFIQYGDEFGNWFANIKNQLSTDAAGNLQNQIDNIEADSLFQPAGGTATAITLTISGTLVNGYPVNFVASANNSGSSTTINGKLLYKPGTTTAPNLVAGKAYTVWYNSASDCFFIKASAIGDAVAADVLAGKKFSNDFDTEIPGTMVNQSAQTNPVSITQNGAGTIWARILQGAYLTNAASGYPEIVLYDANFIASNLKKNTSIFNLVGTYDPISLAPGETLFYSDDVEASSPFTSYNLYKKVQISTKGGTVRVRFAIRSGNSSYTTAYGRIYVNGSPRGIERTNNSTTAVTFTEDITINAGDTVEIWFYSNGTGSYACYLNNFRLYHGNEYPIATKISV